MKILVLSDTHIPRTAPDLPPAVYRAISAVDMILHAGDFVEIELYEKLLSLKKTIAVCGNMDSLKLRSQLKAKELIEVAGCRIGLIHGYGAPTHLMETVCREFPRVDVIVFGHSHKPLFELRDKIYYLNPGSPTDTTHAPYNSYGLLEISKGKVEGKIVRL